MTILKRHGSYLDEFVLRPEHEDIYARNCGIKIGRRFASTITVFLAGIVIGALSFYIIFSTYGFLR